MNDLRTAYLGQFEETTANAIAARLEEAGIAWHYKQSGRITRLLFAGEWGVRMFVDSRRLEEARALVENLSTDGDDR